MPAGLKRRRFFVEVVTRAADRARRRRRFWASQRVVRIIGPGGGQSPQCAPSSIQRLINSIFCLGSGFQCSPFLALGIASISSSPSFTEPCNNLYSRLLLASPGTMSCPVSPPLRASSLLSRRKPEAAFLRGLSRL